MKKILLFSAAIATLSLGACSNDEIVERPEADAISFRAALGKNTRATEVTAANLGGFKVSAIKGTENFFQGVAVSKTSETRWDTQGKYYWPTTSELTFGAWAPADLTGVEYSVTSKKITAYKPSLDVANQKDVLVATNKGTKAANGTTGVEMYFHHALSQIQVDAASTLEGMKVKVLGVKLANFKGQGDFDFPTGVTGTGVLLNQNLWKNVQTPTAYAAMGASSTNAVTLTADLTNKGLQFGKGNFMVIPKNNSTTAFEKANLNGTYIGLYVQFTRTDGSLVYPNNGTSASYAFVAVPVKEDWLPGKKYVYQIKFGGTDGNGGAGLVPNDQNIPDKDDNGTTGTAPEGTTPNQDPKGDGVNDHGEQVLGQPIWFTVKVEDWSTANTEIILPNS